MHVLRLYTVTKRFISIGSSFEEELCLRDIWTGNQGGSYISDQNVVCGGIIKVLSWSVVAIYFHDFFFITHLFLRVLPSSGKCFTSSFKGGNTWECKHRDKCIFSTLLADIQSSKPLLKIQKNQNFPPLAHFKTDKLWLLLFIYFFSVRLLSVSAWSFVFFIPANDLRLRRISIPDLIHYIIFLS